MSKSGSKIGNAYVITSMLLSALVILLILFTLLLAGWDAVREVGWRLLTLEWNPPAQKFGILSMLYGSAAVTIIALAVAVPLGGLAAIFTSEMLAVKYRFYVKSLLELLAGIPSIIYGLIGVAFFSVWIGRLFDLSSGRTILTAGFLLAIMILPTIITLSDDALNNVPQKYRESARGLGLYSYEVTFKAVLPIAKSDIIGAILLALGRALGETMAVMLVIGSIDRIPRPFFNLLSPGQTITSKLGREMAETAFGSLHFSAMIFMGLLLMLITLGMTSLTQRYFKPERRLHE